MIICRCQKQIKKSSYIAVGGVLLSAASAERFLSEVSLGEREAAE